MSLNIINRSGHHAIFITLSEKKLNKSLTQREFDTRGYTTGNQKNDFGSIAPFLIPTLLC